MAPAQAGGLEAWRLRGTTLLVVFLMSPLLAWAPPGLAAHCTNAAPSVLSTTDDAVPRTTTTRYAWDETTVTVTLTGSDPDGDPLVFLYRWGDAGAFWEVAEGATFARTFAYGLVAPATLDVGLSLRVEDDPSLRCDDALPLSSATLTRSFEVHADPAMTVSSPLPGESCHLGELRPSWNTFDLLAGSCTVAATVVDDSLPNGVLDTVGLYVDGATLTTAGRTTTSFPYASASVPDGPHDLAACASASTDPAGRLFCSPAWRYVDSDCANLPPELAGAVGDGMMGGSVGWSGLAYSFDALAYDLDGDPVAVSWTFADGATASGARATRAFNGLGEHGARVRVTDDVSARCPFLYDLATELDVALLRTIGDPLVRMTRPGVGNSCDLNRVFASTGEDAIAVSCEVEAEMVHDGIPAEAVDRGVVRLDGAFYGEAVAAKTIRTNYNTADRPEGLYALDACWTMKDDRHGRSFCSAPYHFRSIDCSNRAPTMGTVFLEGMGSGGSVGWAGSDYRFDASTSYDLDRDPMVATWTWSDGLVQSGLVVTRSFAAAGVYSATVRLSDDPSVRCPFMPSYAVEVQAPDFTVVAVPTATLTRPLARQSCYGAAWVPTTTAENIVSGGCGVTAILSNASPSVSGLVSGEFRVDGRSFFRSASTTLSTLYNSATFTTAGHVMDACFSAKGDVHGRTFCTDEYVYFNVGT